MNLEALGVTRADLVRAMRAKNGPGGLALRAYPDGGLPALLLAIDLAAVLREENARRAAVAA